MTDTATFVYLLSAVMLAFVWFTIRTTRRPPPAPSQEQKGTSEYTYTGPKPTQSLVDNDQPASNDTTRYVKYVPANHMNRKTRRAMSSLARRNRISAS